MLVEEHVCGYAGHAQVIPELQTHFCMNKHVLCDIVTRVLCFLVKFWGRCVCVWTLASFLWSGVLYNNIKHEGDIKSYRDLDKSFVA